MADIKLDPKTGDLSIVQLTAGPIEVPILALPGCEGVIQEDSFEVLQEDDSSFICTEDAPNNEPVAAGVELIGEPAMFDITEEEDDITLRLKRALKTPVGYLSMYYLTDSDVEVYDSLYGNAVYQELSEGLTLNFLARVRTHVGDAIRRAGLTAKIKEIDVGILDSHTVQIYISYTDSINPTVVPIII